ncbi:hypothetical protein ACFSQ7_27395 [Paenibacillus rhizoplanae]
MILDGKSTTSCGSCASFGSGARHPFEWEAWTSARGSKKSAKWFVQISIERPTKPVDGDEVMGIDLGLKVPAVAVTSSGKTKILRKWT